MKRIKNILLLVAVMSLTTGEHCAFSCTGGIVLGLSSAEGNMLAATNDWYAPENLDESTVNFVESTGQNRVLQTGSTGWATFLNEKGVGLRGFFRAGRGKKAPANCQNPGQRLAISTLMDRSDTAKTTVEKLSSSLTECGTGMQDYGKAALIIDPLEGYLLEALDYKYGKPDNHAVLGPMNNTVFVTANFYFDKRLRAHQEGIGAGYYRAGRMWELLVKQQYASIDLQPVGKSGITLAYMMKVLRDRGALTAHEDSLSPYTTPGREALSLRGETVMTQNAQIIIAAEKHPNFLSVMWITLGEPNSTPFLPFYIGMSVVPVSCTTLEAATVFHKLRLALDFHPEYYLKVQELWTIFELQTIGEAKKKEQEIKTILKETKHKRKDAENKSRILLTDFVQSRVDKALELAMEMTKMLENLPLLETNP